MATIDLTPNEIALLRSALGSAEYWDHRDYLPHNNGYIIDPDESQLDTEEARDAWEEVQELRALDARLLDLQYSNG